ncbi:aspartyl-phosphate phosphatase Spo0E family protein [Alicyclobacillus tolerans]|uniref:aspartyl-phosphate phosphatase Spo0E family protein n=1 Tax=Alicyclobacillus tolerans TaxID=90970 RepID=UPI001F2EE4BB|nr:aspartyl-phosphate phosphatase Spo0E family protein [Alicyclobacillus tolerans]MCF8564665.1 aspartyl-phosphate phosphatase Spo0E family protein [Alicyclobacillus tolerans]
MYEYVDIIEYLREKMIHLAEANGSLTHRNVVVVSQRLDRFIVQAQKQRTGITTELNVQQEAESMSDKVTTLQLAWG